MDENGGRSLASVAVASFGNGAGELAEFIRIRNFNLKLNQTLNTSSKKNRFFKQRKRRQIRRFG